MEVKEQQHQQLAAEDAQLQAHKVCMQATPTAAAAPAGRNLRETIVQPILGGEKKIYHTNGTIEFETADGERNAEEDAYD